ncbi:hypothetical protein GA0116948_11437 [Chitinophaga costaii]|uniref:Uncharacterized protein n=1 Tax=Chitinophaga costaii TaxID=1335309 RepID=A0A1C4FG91_9BACT|nr:hypothetical protein [Chitinophaga costaii]PUZ20147.1 hypothetical protein DCM91_19650 [Chitinophaga costaii]SCC55037.1 hypothetical protein GA0116948_11437 [Chitinophaga costaii]
MAEKEIQTILSALKALETKFDHRFDVVEERLGDIEGQLKRIEIWTPYNSNQDTVAELAALKK